MRPSADDIPMLTDVVVPGRRAARGQAPSREERERRATDIDNAELYESFFGHEIAAEGGEEETDVGIEVIVDHVLDKHVKLMRAELIAEFTALLESASKDES